MKVSLYITHAALWLAIGVVGPSPDQVSAGTVVSEILQKQRDRIYLPHGEESLIMPGARFFVVCGEDTTATGTIEWSHPGVAISRPMAGLSAMKTCAEESVWVTIPDVDSSSAIHISIDPRIPIDYALNNNEPLDPLHPERLGPTSVGNDVWKVTPRAERLSPPAEGSISYAAQNTVRSVDQRSIVVEAPYIAALVPNLSKKVNAQGFLTTSAYYRFGDIHLPYLLGGAVTTRHDRFDREDSTSSRLYPFVPERGRGLLRGVDDLPKSIQLSFADGLRDAASFFADVFSRDKLSVEVTKNDTTADIYLVWLPFRQSDPIAGPRTLLNLLLEDDPTNGMQKEALTLIGQYLQLAEGSQSDEARDYYLNLVDRSFKEDLGAFPLFRPSLVVTASNRLRNLRTDLDGCLLMSDLILLTAAPAINVGGEQ